MAKMSSSNAYWIFGVICKHVENSKWILFSENLKMMKAGKGNILSAIKLEKSDESMNDEGKHNEALCTDWNEACTACVWASTSPLAMIYLFWFQTEMDKVSEIKFYHCYAPSATVTAPVVVDAGTSSMYHILQILFLAFVFLHSKFILMFSWFIIDMLNR